MAYLKANGHPVADGTLAVPRWGRAVADLRLGDGTIEAGAAVTLAFQDGTRYAMTAVATSSERGLCVARLVGGKGKLGASVPAKFYENVPANTVLRDILTDAGETAGSLALTGSLKNWTRRAGTAAEALAALFAQFPGQIWRVMPDGKVWAGTETWADGPKVAVRAVRPGEGSYLLEANPAILPGHRLADIGQVGRVVQRVGAKLETEVWTDAT